MISAYRNLNRPGVVWSVKSNKTGRVLARSNYVLITDALLKVSQKGRARVLRQKRKNVHAYVKGTWVRGDFKCHCLDFRGFDGVVDETGNKVEWVRIAYNPYKNETFVIQSTGTPVTRAERVILAEDGSWALNPRFNWGDL